MAGERRRGSVAVATPSFAAGTVAGTVSAGKGGLAVRAAASPASAALGSLRNGTRIVISCQVDGPKTKGRVRTTTRWDRLANGTYVSDAYVRDPKSIPLCPPPAPVLTPVVFVPPTGWKAVGMWVAPVPGRGSSGFRTASRPDHDGVDIMVARFTPIPPVTVRSGAYTPVSVVFDSGIR